MKKEIDTFEFHGFFAASIPSIIPAPTHPRVPVGSITPSIYSTEAIDKALPSSYRLATLASNQAVALAQHDGEARHPQRGAGQEQATAVAHQAGLHGLGADHEVRRSVQAQDRRAKRRGKSG